MLKKKRIKIFLAHALAWTAYTVLFHLLALAYADPFPVPWHNSIVKLILSAYIFYTAAYIMFPFCLQTKRKFIHLAYFLPISIVINFLLRYGVLGYVLPYLADTQRPPETSYQFFIYSLQWWVQFTLYGLAYYMVFRTIKSERKLRETETARLNSEKERLQLQYNYLKTQINPHFLFNTLNFFYGSTRHLDENVASGILQLSEIMRYSLEEGDSNGRVALANEWEQVRNYIKLQRLRSDDKLQVAVEQKGPLEGMELPPHVLLTVLENAFKHGDLKKPGQPLSIALHTGNAQLQFTVTNALRDKPRPDQLLNSNGMGLANVAQRLAHEYGGRAVFEYGATGDLYRVHMILPVGITPARLPETQTAIAT
jgi:two-component system, LytTR family, sensor kinase